jgi:hypothetical protein
LGHGLGAGDIKVCRDRLRPLSATVSAPTATTTAAPIAAALTFARAQILLIVGLFALIVN